jgi:uncharacterized protein with HEPN domain
MSRDEVYLRHILEATERIAEYISAGKAEFLARHHWQDAVIRQLEIIGEATKNLSQDIRDSSQDIPWKRIAGLRDVLIHDYMGVDLEAVWEIAVQGVPELGNEVERLLDRR